MTHLKIEQNSTPERVSSSLITALYNLSLQQLDGTSNLVGELVTNKYGRSRINALQARFPDLHITADVYSIDFLDPNVETMCAYYWGSDGVITEQEAAAVTSFGTVFENNTLIEYFPESRYFTSVINLLSFVFSGCTNLKTFDFTNIRSFGSNAFYNSGLTGNITLNVSALPSGVFGGCSNLKKVTLLDGFTNLGDNVFQGSGVEEIVIPSTFTTYTSSSFSGTLLKELDFSATSLTTLNAKIAGITTLEEVKFPNTLTSLTNDIFLYDTGLKTIDLSNTQITQIPQYGFHLCSSLDSLTLPSTVTIINQHAFRDCSSLTSFDFTNITKIGDSAFSGSGLTSVNIPDTCTSLKSASGTGTSSNFASCPNLTTARIPSWLTNMEQMFRGCQNLETIINTSLITYLGAYGLVNCKKLKVLEVGAVTKIDNYALQAVGSDVTGGCALLLNATTPPQLGTNWKMGARLVIYVPDAAVSTYNSDSAWSNITVYPMSSYTPS